MKNSMLIILILLVNSKTFSQEQRILCFDLKSKQVDTLLTGSFDSLKFQEITQYFNGTYNADINILNQIPPHEFTFPESQFTLKKQASLDYNINDYPIRTSIKLFKSENDSLKSKCSGSIISKKHVLTACHCVAGYMYDTLLYDSMFVCPVYDNGEANSNFRCSWVNKIYIFENWNEHHADFAILELEKSIGEKTGWISIGFNSNDSELLDGIFYKFSYPAITMFELDSNLYNGDTMYYNYGIVDLANENNLGIENTTGIRGESGSSLIKIQNNTEYTSYGVLSYADDLTHCRLTNETYFAIKSIIQHDLDTAISPKTDEEFIKVYPNPASDNLQIEYLIEIEILHLEFYDLWGRKLIEKSHNELIHEIDISSLPCGIYFLVLRFDDKTIRKKIIKYGR